MFVNKREGNHMVVHYVLVCPLCRKDKIGASGLGEKWVHCGACFIHIPKDECIQVEATSSEEVATLSRDAD